MKLPYEMAINRIENIYLAVPKNDETSSKTIICCDEISAFILSAMAEDLTEAQTLERVKSHFPQTQETVLAEKVKSVREYIRNINPESTELKAVKL